MLMFDDAAHLREVVELAREMMEIDGMEWNDALVLAMLDAPALTDASVRYAPARIVWFDASGQPATLPDFMTD